MPQNPNSIAFVTAWQAGASLVDVAIALGMPMRDVRRTEQVLRAKGVRLKQFAAPAAPPDGIDVDALNAIIDKPAG